MKVLLASVAMFAVASPAAAQVIGDTPNEGRSDGTTAQNSTEIGDIVVTASRRAENLQRSALSIQAITGDALARSNVTKPEDLNAVAPGVAIASGGNYPQVYIRGVGNGSTNALAEGAVAFNLDGVYISQTQTTRGMFYDLERVEVLKGPQGTLYGRNASGGAINVITVKPRLGEIGGFAEVQAGNYNLLQGAAAINLPVGETVAVRVAGQIVDRDGYLSDGYNDEKTRSARVQLLWQPTTDFSLLLNGNYQHVGGNGAGAVSVPGGDFVGVADPRITAIYQAQPGIGGIIVSPKKDGYLDVDLRAIGAELNWNLGFATLTLIPAYRDSIQRDAGYVPGFLVANEQRDKQTSVEVRLGHDGEKLKWVVGGYFFNEQQNNRNGDPLQFVAQGVQTTQTTHFDLQTRSYAAFGQATYSVTDALRFTGGLRYTYERKRLNEALQNFSFPIQGSVPPTCAPGKVFDLATPTPPLFCRIDVPILGTDGAGRPLTYNSITYKAGVEYDLAPRSMAYANVSTGFKSGGFFQAPPPNTFRPEKLIAFEAGVKNRFLDNRLQVNFEAFYWIYRDHQETSIGPTTIPGYSTLLVYNAGRAKSYGADLDLVFRATAQDELGLKVQYNKTTYNSFDIKHPTFAFGPPLTACSVGPLQGGFQNIDCSGRSLVRAPLWSGVASYDHVFDLDTRGSLTARASVQFSSAYTLATEFLPQERQRAFAIGNFDLTYASLGGRWVVSAFVHNIGDKQVLTAASRQPFISAANPLAGPIGLLIAPVRPPRTFGGRIRFNF